jgi:4-hydroxybenzoate polyprenyltransferase
MPDHVRLLRPAEWVKNTFVFAALLFGEKIGDWQAVQLALVAFFAFCFTSSAGYIVNDIVDRDRDRQHPIKRHRPLARGSVSPGEGVVLCLLLLGLAGGISYAWLPWEFAWVLGSYLALTLLYSAALKHRMLLDVITIAMLFVIRALAGALAIEVPVSPWLMVCTFMLCLFLGFGKRRCEIAMLGDEEAIRAHRPTLIRYTPGLLTHLLSTTGGIAIITFLLYTLDTSLPHPENKHQLLVTLPLVVYGIFRYAMLIELGKATGPTDLIINDPPFLGTVLLWLAAAVYILYRGLPSGLWEQGVGGSLH